MSSPRDDAKSEDGDTVAQAKGSDDAPSSPTKPEAGERPPTGKLLGYTQTYLIFKDRAAPSTDFDGDGKESTEDQCEHEVLFRCGNWCYTGHVVLNRDISLSDMPMCVPLLQRQQSRLHYYCNADGVPRQSSFSAPMQLVYDVADYAADCLSSDALSAELSEASDANAWMDDDKHTFFEMPLDREKTPPCMDDIALVCSKTYARGLIFLTIYFEGSFYFTVADGGGDQPLLDVKFPDVSHHGQGLQLASCGVPTHATFDGRPPPPWYAGLTLWHAMPKEVKIAPPPTRNLSSSSYVQMYFLLRPRAENGGFAVTSAYREVLFRFGSWCYGGSVQLTPNITLADVPHVIPALRMQQSRLEFVYAADSVPATSPYAKPMSYMMKHLPLMEREISSAEDVLSKLVERLTAMGLGDSISAWLEGDASQSFFEFSVVASDAEAKCLEPVELIATKTYFASGILLIVIYFAGSFYCVVGDGGAEQPLLDSKFPDVSAKGRGYQVNSYGEGAADWPGLRKLSVWQSTGAMQAEMEARLGKDAAEAAASASAQPTLATSAAVDEMERVSGSKAESPSSSSSSPAESSSPRVEVQSAKDGSPSSNDHTEGAAADDAADAKSSDRGVASPGSEAKSLGAPLTAEAKDGGGGLRDHGAGLGDTARMGRQSLGAFHRLAPLGKPGGAGGGSELGKLNMSLGNSPGGLKAPWDATGKPLGSLGSPFGKPSPLDFKKSP